MEDFSMLDSDVQVVFKLLKNADENGTGQKFFAEEVKNMVKALSVLEVSYLTMKAMHLAFSYHDKEDIKEINNIELRLVAASMSDEEFEFNKDEIFLMVDYFEFLSKHMVLMTYVANAQQQ